VSQHSNSGIQPESLCENVFDRGAGNLVETAVLGTFGDDNDSTTLATFFAVLQRTFCQLNRG
jgi:hypothetical protein